MPPVTSEVTRPEILERVSATPQRRVLPVELRIDRASDGAPKLVGHAAVFDVLSEDLGGFREIIRPGAFTKTLADGADVRCLYNHDPNYVIGRTRSGTLTLAIDEVGLRFECAPPDTTWARDLMVTLERRDVDQCSFQFWIQKRRWMEEEGEMPILELLEVRLLDVSPVTFPAYPQTDVELRSRIQIAAARAGIDLSRLAAVLGRSAPGEASTEDRAFVSDVMEHLQGYVGDSGRNDEARVRAANRRRELELLALEV